MTIFCLSCYKLWSSACIWRCSGFCRRNGEAAASAVCFVWWLYYTTILRRWRLGSCSSCTLRTPGSFFISAFYLNPFLVLHPFFPLLFCEWYGLGCRKLGEEKQCRDGGGGYCCCCWDCCFCLFFHRRPTRPLERLAWFALEQEELALMYSFRVQADVILRAYSGYNTSWALFLLDKIFPKVRDSRDDG